jgi:Fungal specific transcription factor domain
VEEDTLSPEVRPGEMLIRRMGFLKPSQSWMEAEQRRRLFWTVFLMDRFCNVSTGWNVSLTSADVKRRLPCEGSRWAREIEVQAPYFGISDTQGCSPHSSPPANARHASDPAEPVPIGQREAIGGFAYCIEATESLSLVANFFLHHALDILSAEKAQLWLIRFKELDLRMVQ